MERQKRKIVKFLEIEQVGKLEENLVNRTKEAIQKEEKKAFDIIAIRDFAVISLIYACALRISEPLNLKLNDVDLEGRELRIFDGKGGDRYVPIPEPTIKCLKEWLSVRPNWENNPYFFTNVKGTTRPGKIRPLNRTYYNQLIKHLAIMSGITLNQGEIPHPHTLRHSRAMEFYDNGVLLEVIQKILGHKFISTTQIYAEVRDERASKAQEANTKGLVTI